MTRTTSLRRIAAGLLALAAFFVPVPSATAQDDRVAELERKVDALASELEQLRLGTAADTSRMTSRRGLGPATSKIYGVARGLSIGGYGEMLYENFDKQREDDAPSGMLDRIDVLRVAFSLGHRFSDELLLNTAIAIQHGGVQEEGGVSGRSDPLTGAVQGEARLSGEVVLEFAFLEWARQRSFGIRAGMLLMPLGLTNEVHEPPRFIGARRSEVEQRIIPTTWSANGVGAIGDLASGLSYRIYLTEGLDAAGFDADGIRGGLQGGSQSLFTQPAVAARLDWARQEGTMIGASLYTGNAWQDFQPTSGTLDPRVTLWDVHGMLEWRGLRARALWAQGTLSDAGPLSDALGFTGTERLGESFFGTQVEAAYDLVTRFTTGSRYGLEPYLRWEMFDTQDDVPDGAENPALERTIWTVGAAFRPHPNVIVKADRQWRSNEADTGTSQWNVAAGYLF